jgi:hypothetical protein
MNQKPTQNYTESNNQKSELTHQYTSRHIQTKTPNAINPNPTWKQKHPITINKLPRTSIPFSILLAFLKNSIVIVSKLLICRLACNL